MSAGPFCLGGEYGRTWGPETQLLGARWSWELVCPASGSESFWTLGRRGQDGGKRARGCPSGLWGESRLSVCGVHKEI